MSVLQNYVTFQEGIPKTLKIDKISQEPRSWVDKKTGAQRTLTRQIVHVVEEDGVPVNKIFSHYSEKLAGTLQFWWNSGILPAKTLVIRRFTMPGRYEYEASYVG